MALRALSVLALCSSHLPTLPGKILVPQVQPEVSTQSALLPPAASWMSPWIASQRLFDLSMCKTALSIPPSTLYTPEPLPGKDTASLSTCSRASPSASSSPSALPSISTLQPQLWSVFLLLTFMASAPAQALSSLSPASSGSGIPVLPLSVHSPVSQQALSVP